MKFIGIFVRLTKNISFYSHYLTGDAAVRVRGGSMLPSDHNKQMRTKISDFIILMTLDHWKIQKFTENKSILGLTSRKRITILIFLNKSPGNVRIIDLLERFWIT